MAEQGTETIETHKPSVAELEALYNEPTVGHPLGKNERPNRKKTTWDLVTEHDSRQAAKEAAHERGLDPQTTTWAEITEHDSQQAAKEAAIKRGLDPERATWDVITRYDSEMAARKAAFERGLLEPVEDLTADELEELYRLPAKVAQDHTMDTTQAGSEAFVDELIVAAEANQAAQRAEELREQTTAKQEEISLPEPQQTTSQVDIQTASQRMEEIQYELMALEKALKAGNKNAAGDLAILLEEQTALQEKLKAQSNHNDAQQNNILASLLDRYIGRPLGRLLGKMTAPVNQPLETLRSMALQTWEQERRASGKSNFLGIAGTVHAMMAMRQSPSELASSITEHQTQQTTS